MIFRRAKLPGSARPRLAADERIVAWAATADGGYLVATNRGLWLPQTDPSPAGTPADPEGRAQLGWHEITKATWSGRELRVIPGLASDGEPGVITDGPPLGWVLHDPGHLPHQVRERVTRSVAFSSHHPLPGGGGARVVGRRVPGRDGLRWQVRFDDGVDAGDPANLEVAAELVDQARRSLGP